MPSLDQAKADQFAQRMIDVSNHGFLAMMASIGHHTGLFDAMADLPPATSAEISSATGLNERYVREWLGAMVTGRIVDYDLAQRTYALPPEHAASLTRRAGASNAAAGMLLVGYLGSVEQGIVECFRKGGGVPYSAFLNLHHVLDESSGLDDTWTIQTVLPAIAGLVSRLEADIDVLDVGCGSGHDVNVMARQFPNSRFTGYDFSDEGIASARDEVRRWGLMNACFVIQDAAAFPESKAYDFITAFDSIHDQAQPAQVLAAIARSLRSDGTFLMVDIDASSNLEDNLAHPLAPMLYSISTMHCMTVSLALDGAGLGTMWGEQLARQMLAQAGFARVEVLRFPDDTFNCYYIAGKA